MSARFLSLSLAVCSLTLLFSPAGQAQQMGTNAVTSVDSAPAVQVDPASRLISEAIMRMDANDPDGALAKLSQAIKLSPRIPGAYVLRASIYYQRKLWPQAEADFQTASDLSPNSTVIKFNLIEIKFLQKHYDEARPGYVSLESDPDLGDFATFKVFLCDLQGKHDALAAQEFDAFNKARGNPSYYYSNAVWSLTHQKVDDARGWLISASHIYAPSKNAYYLRSLQDLGYLPLPASPE